MGPLRHRPELRTSSQLQDHELAEHRLAEFGEGVLYASVAGESA